ncbi:hypothetical protein CYMTET_51979, partial [Cymbomonas tetramitiformis]
PGEEASAPGEEASGPGEEASVPGEEASVPGEEASVPGEEASVPGEEACVPGEEASVPGEEASVPGEEASVPGEEASVPGEEASDPGEEASVPGEEAHLLFEATHGDADHATALADTYGTASFAAAAAVTQVPEEFLQDMEQRHGAKLRKGCTVLELLKVWRLDSGVYEDVAEAVLETFREANLEPPTLMNSNLGSVQEVLAAGALPERVRPQIVGFGTLLDGFLPFDIGDGQNEATISLCSVVMKAVQAHVPGIPSTQVCAGKLGDDTNSNKQQLDPRLPKEVQSAVIRNALPPGELYPSVSNATPVQFFATAAFE